MNGTKALLAGALALLGLIAYKETNDILFESVIYNREDYQGYATFMMLAVASAVGSIVSLALSFNFVERWLTQEPRSEAPTQTKDPFTWEKGDWEEPKAKSILDDDTW